MMSSIHDDNNNAVDHMLMGHPKDAVNSLIHGLETWKKHGRQARLGERQKNNPANLPPSPCSSLMQVDAEQEVGKHLFSVELGVDSESSGSTFPFLWYARPIAIASSCDGPDEEMSPTGGVRMCHELNAVVLLYNLGIAYQLEAEQKRKESDFVVGRLTSTAAFESYTLALKALVSCQERNDQPMTISERLSFGLLHVAIVNNLLFLYGESADLEGVATCLTVLRKVLAAVCNGLALEHVDDFTFFHSNAILFPTPGSLSLAPAA